MKGFIGGKEALERLELGKLREIVVVAVPLLVREGYKSTDIISVFQETSNLSISCLVKKLCNGVDSSYREISY